MLKVIKYGCTFEIPKSCVVKADATYDGAIIVLSDGTEIRFTFSAGSQLRTLMGMIQVSKSDIVILNLDAAIAGQYDKVIEFRSIPVPEPPVATLPDVPILEDKDSKKTKANKKTVDKKSTAKKKLGRPRGSKNKK